MSHATACPSLRTGSGAGNRQDPFPASPDLRTVLKTFRRWLEAGSVLKMEGGDAQSVYVVLSGWLALSKSLADPATASPWRVPGQPDRMDLPTSRDRFTGMTRDAP